MDSFEWNKIAGWMLAALSTVLALIIVTGMVFEPVLPAKTAYIVEGVEVEATADAAPVEAEKSIAFYLASATPDKGAAVFKKCAACHGVEKGGAAGIGPNLYGVVGANHGQQAGFGYSEPMLAMKGKAWDWEAMSAWLKSPKGYMPGTKMAFAGLSKPEERAAVIAYLNSKSDSPLTLPPVPAEAPEAPEAATTPPGTPTSEQPAPAAGKAPDVPEVDAAAAAKQPEGNIGGPGASSVTGTSKTEK